MIRSPLLPLLACVLVSLHTYGQTETAESPESAPAKGRQAWVMATSLPKDVESPIKILIGNEVTEVKIMKRALGVPIKVPSDGIMQVIKPIIGADDKPAYERLAAVQVPDGVNKSLVLLFPVPNLPAPLKFQAKVIDLGKFRGGGALFINLTKFDVGVTLGDGKTVLKPGQTEIVTTGDFEGKKNAAISYHYRKAGQTTWNLISSSTTTLFSERREILIFSYNDQTTQIDYHGLSLLNVD